MGIRTDIESIFPTEGDVPEKYGLPGPVEQRECLIDGEFRPWDGPMQEVLSPVCLSTQSGPVRQVIGSFPLVTEKEALDALDAAVRAYDGGRGRWPTLPVAERIRFVREFACRMKERRAEVVRLLMWEIGKSLQDAEKEFDRTIDYIDDTIDALKELDRVSSRFVIEQGIIGQIRRAPLGVALCMGPFNYPLNETFTTLIPALIMGNTVVIKPPRHGVLLFSPLMEAFRDAFPPGVVNIVYGEGREIAAPLMASGKVDVLAFIGTSRAADTLQKAASQAAPAAVRARPGGQEPRHRPARCRPGPGRRRMPDREPVLQRAALHGAQDPLRPRPDCRRVPATGSRRRSAH